jgi:glycosyltransferase involved in cell wall biosynthesis
MHKPKVLLALTEPPSNSSGLGTLWAKLSIGISNHIELDFIAPELDSCFATKDNSIGFIGNLTEITDPPIERIASVKINSPDVRGLSKAYWVGVRVFTKILEQLRRNRSKSYPQWVNDTIYHEVVRLSSRKKYDYLAVHIPSLELAERIFSASTTLNIPLIAIIGDPQGWRNGNEFVPNDRDLQQKILTKCVALIIPEATYQSYYRQHFQVDPQKVVFFSDSYIREQSDAQQTNTDFNSFKNESGEVILLHWGAIAEYRDPAPLIDGICHFNAQKSKKLSLIVAGKIFSRSQRSYATQQLGGRLVNDIPSSYHNAKMIIPTADIYVVIVSNRHMDNIPSKLIEGLSFRRPMLILASDQSAAAQFVLRNGIGVVVSSESATDVSDAIEVLLKNYNEFVSAFDTHEINSYDINVVGEKLGAGLVNALCR